MAKKGPSHPVIAVFDFDHTLIDRESGFYFYLHSFGFFYCLFRFFFLFPNMLSYLLGFTSRQQIKEKLLYTFFGGMGKKEFDSYCLSFAEEKIPEFTKKEALERLDWHLKEGHHCILMSASIENYLKPWAKKQGFHEVIASKLEINPEGKITGFLQGKNCWGEEKVKRLVEEMGPKENYTLYVYGDSGGDLALLAIADHPFYRTFTDPK